MKRPNNDAHGKTSVLIFYQKLSSPALRALALQSACVEKVCRHFSGEIRRSEELFSTLLATSTGWYLGQLPPLPSGVYLYRFVVMAILAP